MSEEKRSPSEQAIAATVGNGTDLSKRLREVHGLHAFAELFGFDWTGESDWDWHDVACAMADAVDAATVGAGTCHDLAETPSYRDKTEFKCSECGYEYSAVGGFGCDYGEEPDFNFCPNCGRRVVSE